MTVQKWRLEDPAPPPGLPSSYTFEINPNEMGSPMPVRQVQVQGTTAVNGQTLMWEGARQPATLQFGGTLLTYEQYNALRHWTYERKGRLFLWDHFGRRMVVVLHNFSPVPVRTTGRFRWRHTWTIDCTVISVATPLLTSNTMED